MTEKTKTMEEKLVELLLRGHMTITTAESCTGGLLAGTLINVSGISTIYEEGYITYANKSKQKLLGVRADTLERYGAVSRYTAKEMAEGAAREAGAQVAIAVTGIAGPDGGSAEKPVGLVYIGCCVKGVTEVIECFFSGDRCQVRSQAVAKALELTIACVNREIIGTDDHENR